MSLDLNLLTEWLLTYAIHSTALLGAATLADLFFLRGRSYWQELVWKSALLGGIVSATLQLAAGGAAPFSLTVPDTLLPGGQIQAAATPAPAAPIPSDKSLAAAQAWPTSETSAAPAAAADAEVSTVPNAPWIGIWLLGAALMLARLQLAVVRLRYQLRDRRPFPAHLLPDSLPSWVKVSACGRISQPMAVGLREICLPRAMVEMPAAHIRAAVGHELAHLARLDGVWRWTCLLIQSVLFFQPLNTLAVRRIAAAAEQGSDALALKTGTRRSDLVEVLAAFALQSRSGSAVGRSMDEKPAAPLLASAMAGRRHEVVSRIENLLADRLTTGPGGRLLMPAIVAVSLLATVSLPTLSTGSERRGTRVEIVSDDKSHTSISLSHSDEGLQLKLRAEGRFVVNDDETALASLEGKFDLTVRRPEGRKRIRFDGDADEIGATYWIDGSKRPFDAEARAWFAEQLPMLLRLTGIDAEARAGRIYRRSGIAALRDELKLLRSDSTRRRYISGVGKLEALRESEVAALLALVSEVIGGDLERRLTITGLAKSQAAQLNWEQYFAVTAQIRSDLEQRLALAAALPQLAAKPELGEAYVRASRQLRGDLEHRLALEALLDNELLGKAGHALVVEAAADLGSDLEQRLLLSRLLDSELDQPTALALVALASEQIGSDLELRLLLSEVLDRFDHSEIRAAVAQAAERMGGFEKKQLLRRM